MPRFIIEHGLALHAETQPHRENDVRLVRTFSMGGITFDVFIAKDRDAFLRHVARAERDAA